MIVSRKKKTHFGSHFGQVVRVAQLCGDVETKVLGVLDDVVA